MIVSERWPRTPGPESPVLAGPGVRADQQDVERPVELGRLMNRPGPRGGRSARQRPVSQAAAGQPGSGRSARQRPVSQAAGSWPARRRAAAAVPAWSAARRQNSGAGPSVSWRCQSADPCARQLTQSREQLAVTPARWLGKPRRLRLTRGVVTGVQGVQPGRAARRPVRDLIVGAGVGRADRRPVQPAQRRPVLHEIPVLVAVLVPGKPGNRSDRAGRRAHETRPAAGRPARRGSSADRPRRPGSGCRAAASARTGRPAADRARGARSYRYSASPDRSPSEDRQPRLPPGGPNAPLQAGQPPGLSGPAEGAGVLADVGVGGDAAEGRAEAADRRRRGPMTWPRPGR